MNQTENNILARLGEEAYKEYLENKEVGISLDEVINILKLDKKNDKKKAKRIT